MRYDDDDDDGEHGVYGDIVQRFCRQAHQQR